MVETRSGLSAEREGEAGAEGSQPLQALQRDTAATAAPSTPRTGGRFRRGGGAGGAGSQGLSDSQAYTLLALALGTMALPLMLTPKLAARAVFGSAADPLEDQHTHTLALLACSLLAAASLAFALEECARKHMLNTFTADTLKLGLVGFAGANILLQLYYPATLTALTAVLATIAQAATLSLPASQLFVAREDRNRLWHDFRRMPRNLRSALWLRQASLPAALYLLLTIAFPVAGLTYFLAPKFTLFHTFGYAYGKSTYMAWKAVGGGMMTVLPALTYTLKDKAENQLLGRSVARTLNLGLMFASVGHLLVFGPILNQGHGGFMLPGLIATWGTALLASMAGLAAPEAAGLAEQAAQAAMTE